MAQVLEFKLPDLGEGLTEAEIVRWLVQVGDVVAIDQPVVEVETAKAMVEVPCPYGGVVTARFGEEGTELPVGAPLLTVAVGPPASGEETEGSGNVLVGYGTGASPARRRRVRPTGPMGAGARQGAGSGGASVPPGSAGTAPDGASTSRVGTSSGGASTPSGAPGTGAQAAPAAAEDSGRPAAESAPHALRAAVETAPASTAAVERPDGPVPVISPLVRRLARENGLDLRKLHGSGPDGLILRADVEYALRAAAATGATGVGPAAGSGTPVGSAPEAPAAQPTPVSAPVFTQPAPASAAQPVTASARAETVSGTRVPLRGVRGAVADKLSRSRREIPDATCWVDADATELMNARRAMQRFSGGHPQTPTAGGPKISLLALLARICTAALARFPELNSTVDMAAREVVRLDRVHLGFAAQTERGLVVPVVRDAHTRNAESLSAEFARLTEAARTGTLTPAQLTGGTFTLNNYGVFGVDGSTPIINHPEAAMLGVGRIVPKPWVHEGELAVRQVVQLSLTFDHRVCDGGTAGGFLRYVADCVEQPAVLLRTL
ncbi:dihydrolipoamide acetyltransferase family protein [Streptomyces ipomoeae]|uniref:Dihydrolipoamide acetyltransferase component of pyruvate dehydrogenase complex n=1 Tax=Streptomyces ipomoeae 91-03 TaxID=698759 RepID=L1KJ48_9ACTN|nr:dihydrolipoamide acetyltransferase family protein [Streptomyces ipomoeae]EKX60594.1 branched-chain alpha-keto acid dehydrogenase subunit E2 [Streptomyces ipomoeae 91-03]MDX2692556.1 dihydrolipoamide acetyltransferase family protein [Streptomyces ipomoeae]MDX2820108.1 dihydrolipoamide acetyltransferase family protein [Streptomyces ipomoeae]MDX2838188.1 dihydrolipoamide acetyltransferase family protein [Streptomyces ipomoeae]MDX2872778.1 dihydrolipoamide acetyltransferase family protein [Stre